jgi:hypothetical protein
MKLIPAAAAVLAAALTLVNVAGAQTLPTPPPPGGPTSTAIFDAMLAVARAASSNPGAAQSAAFSYQAAIQQYNIGDFDRARMSAIAAIGASMPAPLPAPSIVPPSIPQPVYYQMPLLVEANQADAEGYLALARRSMITCGTAGTNPPQVMQQYAAAAAALDAKNYDAAKASSQAVVDYCAAANQALAAQAAAAPQTQSTPIPMTSYKPIPLATLGPDPALMQTPTPATLPETPSPAPARRGFRL